MQHIICNKNVFTNFVPCYQTICLVTCAVSLTCATWYMYAQFLLWSASQPGYKLIYAPIIQCFFTDLMNACSSYIICPYIYCEILIVVITSTHLCSALFTCARFCSFLLTCACNCSCVNLYLCWRGSSMYPCCPVFTCLKENIVTNVYLFNYSIP